MFSSAVVLLLALAGVFAATHARCPYPYALDSVTGRTLQLNFSSLLGDYHYAETDGSGRAWSWSFCGQVRCGDVDPSPSACLSQPAGAPWATFYTPVGYADDMAITYNSSSKTVRFKLAPVGMHFTTLEVKCDPFAYLPTKLGSAVVNNWRVLYMTHRAACYPMQQLPPPGFPVPPPVAESGSLIIKGNVVPYNAKTPCSGQSIPIKEVIAPGLNGCSPSPWPGLHALYRVVECSNLRLRIQAFQTLGGCSSTPFLNVTYSTNSCVPDILRPGGGYFYYEGCTVAP